MSLGKDHRRNCRKRPPLSVEELELLSTTNLDLEAKVRKRSFDYQKFCERTDNVEPGQFVLQSHLYLDHVLTILLAESLVKPEKINLKRMGFSQKLAFISAMGLVSEDLIRSIFSINEIRNKIAHDLDYAVSDRVKADFMNCVSKRIKKIVEGHGGIKENIYFELIIHYILHLVEIERQNNALNRILLRKEHSALRATLLGNADAIIAD